MQTNRSRSGRVAAIRALVRVVHHYGGQPEFVVLGGLVPELWCTRSSVRHMGTTDIDVQVDLEVALGSINAMRLEQALMRSRFRPDRFDVWRWHEWVHGRRIEVKFELIADLADRRTAEVVRFGGCRHLGAINVPGSGYASRDYETKVFSEEVDGDVVAAQIRVAGLAGFVMSKVAAARARSEPRDWYDIAYVLLYNDQHRPTQLARLVRTLFGGDLLRGPARTGLIELQANFMDVKSQGPRAFAAGVLALHTRDELSSDPATDAVLAVQAFCEQLDL